MKEKFKVVMVFSENISKLYFHNPTEILKYGEVTSPDLKGINIFQNLYIISNDEIKEGDYYILIPEDKIKQFKGITYNLPIHRDWKKIVATTDKELATMNVKDVGTLGGIPQIPESFIQTYIKAYNEGKPITEVGLEVDIVGASTSSGAIVDIKTNKNNDVIIHLKEEKLYSKEDILMFLSDNFLEIRNTIPNAKLRYKEEYFINLMKNIEDYGK